MANVGNLDRTLRFTAGALLLLVSLVAPMMGLVGDLGVWKYVLAVVGVVLIATAAIRFCPAYAILGIKTCASGDK
jgi:hypothetical protein